IVKNDEKYILELLCEQSMQWRKYKLNNIHFMTDENLFEQLSMSLMLLENSKKQFNYCLMTLERRSKFQLQLIDHFNNILEPSKLKEFIEIIPQIDLNFWFESEYFKPLFINCHLIMKIRKEMLLLDEVDNDLKHFFSE